MLRVATDILQTKGMLTRPRHGVDATLGRRLRTSAQGSSHVCVNIGGKHARGDRAWPGARRPAAKRASARRTRRLEGPFPQRCLRTAESLQHGDHQLGRHRSHGIRVFVPAKQDEASDATTFPTRACRTRRVCMCDTVEARRSCGKPAWTGGNWGISPEGPIMDDDAQEVHAQSEITVKVSSGNAEQPVRRRQAERRPAGGTPQGSRLYRARVEAPSPSGASTASAVTRMASPHTGNLYLVQLNELRIKHRGPLVAAPRAPQSRSTAPTTSPLNH